ELREKAVAYINSDSNGRGFLRAGGSHTLEPFVNEVARSVEDPQTGVTVARRLQAGRRSQVDPGINPDSNFPLAPLGSGSDYTPFLQHLGIASLNISYGGENSGGSYHSIFDSFDYYVRFGDPGFQYGITQAKTTGRLVMRLAAAEILPFRFGPFAERVKSYLDEIIDLTDKMRQNVKHQNELIRNRDQVLAADPTEVYVPPQIAEPVPYINFAPLQNAVARLLDAANHCDSTVESINISEDLNSTVRERINQLLLRSERDMTDVKGLPKRPWFRHQIYAPGFYTGYGVKTLPAVREAVEQKDWTLAEQSIEALAATLKNLEATIREATDLLQ
ncbi:MAG TPA: transferrin receptor-like dimerization domain-containing protein, partial [Acidobacteriota bacterium]|nr:transferrin receptor-like dimerization domain-containing protein [Acidobacteriota bacterium]